MDDMDTGSNASGNSASENLKELSEEDVAFSPPPHDRQNHASDTPLSSAFPLPSSSNPPDGGGGAAKGIGDSSDVIADQLTTGNGSTIGGINLGDSNKSPMAMSASPPTPGKLGSANNTSTLSHPSSSPLESKQLETMKIPESKKALAAANLNSAPSSTSDTLRHDLGVSWMAGTPVPSSTMGGMRDSQPSHTTNLLPPTPVATNYKREPTEKFLREKSVCLEHFHSWNEQDQIDFVEELLAGMCHYQHGTVNAFLKPMLQRDFITLLPKKGIHMKTICLCA